MISSTWRCLTISESGFGNTFNLYDANSGFENVIRGIKSVLVFDFDSYSNKVNRLIYPYMIADGGILITGIDSSIKNEVITVELLENRGNRINIFNKKM